MRACVSGNVLSLKNKLNLSPDGGDVSQETLLNLVAERLIDSNSNGNVIAHSFFHVYKLIGSDKESEIERKFLKWIRYVHLNVYRTLFNFLSYSDENQTKRILLLLWFTCLLC